MAGAEAENSDEEDARAELARQIRRGAIPDAITIHAVRKQRELARQGEGYLPLDDTQRYAADNSRLVCEDDNDRSGGSSGDEGTRGKDMGMAQGGGLSRQQQVLEALETVAESEESDEEMRNWEEQQINKGVNIVQATQHPQSDTVPSVTQTFGVGTGAYPYTELPFPYQQGDYPNASGWGQQSSLLPSNSSVTPLFPERLPPVTIDSVRKRLQSRLEDLQVTHTHPRTHLATVCV